jgi:hypothetical protein
MNKIEYEQALLDGSVFVQPEDVVRHPTLSREQKIKILRRWKYDASELSVPLRKECLIEIVICCGVFLLP